MTPRTVVFAAPREMTIGRFFESNHDVHFSRIPLFKDTSRDQVTGYVLKNDLLSELAEDKPDTPLHTLERKLITVPESFPLPELFNRFLVGRDHIALVAGEFGDMAGIVTIEDVIETLLGMEIVDELDTVKDMQALARQNWEKRAKTLDLIEVSPKPDKAG